MSTPRRMNTRAAQLALLSSNFDNESDSLTSNYPFSAFNVLDQRFDKLSSTLTNTLRATLTKIIKAEILKCEQRIIKEVDINAQIKQLLKESEGSLLQQLEIKLCEKLTEMKTDINNIAERVTQLETVTVEHDTTIKDIKNDISNVVERIANVETKNVNLNRAAIPEDLQIEVAKLRSKVLQQENVAVSCELRINNIPYYSNENLCEMFHFLCQIISVPTPQINSIYRLQTKNKNSPAPTILVKLSSPYEKNYILKSVATFRRNNRGLLRLNMLNFDSNEPFYVNENLSRANYEIFNAAIKLKKKKLIVSAFTLRGVVYVKESESGSPILIEQIEQLNTFFREDNNDLQ